MIHENMVLRLLCPWKILSVWEQAVARGSGLSVAEKRVLSVQRPGACLCFTADEHPGEQAGPQGRGSHTALDSGR